MNPKKVIRKVVPASAVKALEGSYRGSRAQFWQAKYGYPARNLKIIAVTGTNGKTTTASYVNSVLKASGLKTAVYTTAFFEIGGKVTPNHTHMTVTSQRSVQSFFAKARDAKVDWVVMEVTSHALHQGRVAGIKPRIGIVTNLTQEHLDYHKTMEAYASAKKLLFTKYHAKTAILNADDEWYEFFAKNNPANVLSIGQNKSVDFRLGSINSSQDGSSFKLTIKGKNYEFKTKLVGKFNVYNAICAIAVGEVLNLNYKNIAQGIEDLTAVPGRMEKIDEGQDFTVLVDFAITPDALENALTTLRPMTKSNLAIVFGATGDRDATKRPVMGEVVGKLADKIYLTDDETYTEDPVKIRDSVYEGIKNVKAENNTKVVDERLDAIELAFKEAKKGDIVLLTGIGHENYRNMGGQKQPWDEREIARKLLKSLNN